MSSTVTYTFVSSDGISYELQDMKGGKLDIAVGAITITKEREEILDFGYAHFHSGLGIMILADPEFSVVGFISSLSAKFSYLKGDIVKILKLFNLTYLNLILSGLTLTLSLAASPSSAEGKMSSTAEDILQSMSSFIATTKTLSVNADVDYEIISPIGQKLQLSSFVTALIERPAKLHLTRKGMSSDYEIFFNGKLFTVYSRTLNAYSQVEGSGTIDDAFLAHEYTTGLPISGGDFFFSDPFTRLFSGVESSDYMGIAYVFGVRCHHLAFRNAETDWQLWVKAGDQPLPMKYVITTKWVTGAPQYEIRLRDWDTNPEIEAGDFLFSAPEDAKKLDVIPREKFPGIISRGGG